MRNTLGDLNNHLFAEIERLSDEDLKGEELTEEIQRARSISSVSKNIIDNARLILQAQKFKDEKMGSSDLPRLLSD